MSSLSSSSRNQESQPIIHNTDPNSIYDVFLSSESGCADSISYTSCLCAGLQKARISVFWDGDSLSGDDQISPSLLQVIQNSRISVVVLSTGYARSRRCLEVLEQIIECHRIAGRFVLPVFLGVDSDDVRFQQGEFGRAFDDLTQRISDKCKVESWKIAFARICKIRPNHWAGTGNRNDPLEVDVRENWSGNDYDIIRHVNLARGLLDRTDLFVAEYLVGGYRSYLIPQLIDSKPTGVLLLGIWGMVGIGKTTLGKSIYNQNGGNFEGRSFLPNIRHVWEEETRRVYLQERLLFDIYNLPQIKIDSIEMGKKTLKEMLSHKKILLVLDDVNKLEQLNALCESREWFGPGSMIIITTRDRSLLRNVDMVGVDHVQEMKEMDENESYEFFNWCAFKTDMFGFQKHQKEKTTTSRQVFDQLSRNEVSYVGRPPAVLEFLGSEAFTRLNKQGQLSRNAVAYAGQLPLALEVLGCKVFTSLDWDSVSDKLIESPHPILQKVLKRCVDDLIGIEKDIFLDIACFLIGMDQEKVIKALNAFGDFAKDGMRALEDQCLITIDKMNKLRMHVLLQDIGKEIIHEQMRVELGSWSSWIYDLFLSFSGEDTPTTFTSHLYTCLSNAGICVFKDDDGIRRGDRISISLLQAIRRSRISVVVLSRHYANSRWCLQELEKIMECRKTIGQVVVPVFYDVAPSTVRNQTGVFGKAFQNLLKKFSVNKDKEKSWRIALREIGDIAGIEIIDSRIESEDIKNVVDRVTHSLDMLVVDHPVGVEPRVLDAIYTPACTKSKDVLLLGIWGMGGSGKTTIAKAIYNKFGRIYESKSFLQHISKVWKKENGQMCLQEKLLSDINERTKIKTNDIERLCCERTLLVLDDVDKLEQLKALRGSCEWFGSGSIIIITTRDKSLLNELGVDRVYRMEEMDESESMMLFSWHAFKQPSPRNDFIELSRDVVAYCGGLPLALEELGRELCGKKKTEWKSALDRYKRTPHPMIHKALKRSFDGLGDDSVKNIFLEIACFFIGLDQNEVLQKLNGFGVLAASSVPVLIEQSLVTVDRMNKLRMHVLLRDMGREIFRQRSRMQPGPTRIYDVFFSFSKGTPSSFTSCLIGSLEKAGISVYRNDNSLAGDDQIISPSLLQVIQKSRIFVVVLSAGYAHSRRCLQVLEQITECRRIAGQFILPVFLDVSPFEEHFLASKFGVTSYDLKTRISDKDKVESWDIALARIFQIRSFKFFCSIKDYWSDDDTDIKGVVELAKGSLEKRNLFVVEFPVGVKSRVHNATQLVTHRKSKGVLLIGIWGMVGIGKTTIAKAIYNQYGGNFEGRSFLPNIREVWELDKKHVYLQERLLLDIYKLPKIKIDSTKIGKKMLKRMLSHKKVLLVLDDVNKLEQLNILCESREWFGPGSMIIITTRDRSLLREHGVDHVYSMKEMDENESCELFKQCACRATCRGDFDQLSRDVVAYAGGLPLALEVLGSKVSKSLDDASNKPIDSPNPVIQKVLKRCINDLNDPEKSIFLDMACFLNGMDQEEVIQSLNAFGNLAQKGISALEDQCLVTFDEKNKLRIHDLLRDIGREIVCEQMQAKTEPWIYDVFLSFRGEDTRATFTSHLNTCLANAGIYVFMDDDKIRRGDWISISLLQAIKRSRIFVIVLSRHYANSRWCLQELENIIVCCGAYGRVVLPIFYGVDPSAVRKQTGKFGEAFQDLLNRFSVERDKEKSWRRALRQISGIAGIVIKDSRNESEDINKIVEQITGLLDLKVLSVAQHPVGVTSRVKHAIELLNCQQSKDVLLLGILGFGGIGKTTIAKAIYNQIYRGFEGCCFLPDIREHWERSINLQQWLLSDIDKTSKIEIKTIDAGKIILSQRLHHKRVLLVLDGVDKLPQLRALCSSRDWFGPGSRIIITTRHENLLKLVEVDHIFRLSEMDNDESGEHFSWHAFKQESPKEDFVEISRKMVEYCGGLPLAHEVIGSYLFGKGITEWERVLEKLKIIPSSEVHKKLKISFDGLDDDIQKEIFLDIAFFFIGMDQNDVAHILNGCGLYVGDGITDLVNRSLITVDNKNKLGMHHLLRDMGREIIREQTPEPEERSRLWFHEEVLDVLTKQKGTQAVKGMALKLPRTKPISLCTNEFGNMKKLKLLQLAGVNLHGDFEYLSKDLRWLYWHGFSLKCIPPEFYQASLVAIELVFSSVELVWKTTQFMEKLKVLNLSHSHRLTQTPDLSYLPNLEKLLLKDCPSLSGISNTIGDLKKILLIDLEDCTSLPNLPRSFYKLKSLETLIISGCSTIDKLEEDIEQMESLITLIANKTKIKEVPFSIVRSKSIRYISMCGYEGFSRDVFPSLIWSWMSPTNILSFSSLVQTCASSEYVSSDAPKLQSVHSKHKQGVKRILDILDATYCKELEAKPTASQVSNIKRSAIMFDFPNQCHISRSAMSLLLEVGMKSQVTNILRERIIQKLTTSGPDDCLLPSDNYSLTFTCEGSSVIFEVPHVNGGNLETMMLCIVYSSSLDTIIPDCLQNVLITIYTKSTTQVYKHDRLASSEDVDWQSIISKLEPGNKVEVQVVSGYGFIVKNTAVFLIYADNDITDMPEDENIIVSRSAKNRFHGPFTLASLLMSPPFWFGIAAFLIWKRRRSDKRRR